MALRQTNRFNQYRGNRLKTAPAVEPITVDDVKAQIRLSGAADDALLTLYIQAAREQVEEITGLAFIDQVWTLTYDHWPNTGERWWDGVQQMPVSELRSTARASDVMIPRYPLQSVDSITADGDAVTVADTFIVDTQQQPGRLVIKRGATWPVVIDRANGISIEYTAGYGSSASDVPASMRVALTQMVATLYEHRGDECTTEDAYKMSGAKAVFDRYKAAKL